ncbi:hypothetical protein HAHI103713_11835 [Hathewaya histolytica]
MSALALIIKLNPTILVPLKLSVKARAGKGTILPLPSTIEKALKAGLYPKLCSTDTVRSFIVLDTGIDVFITPEVSILCILYLPSITTSALLFLTFKAPLIISKVPLFDRFTLGVIALNPIFTELGFCSIKDLTPLTSTLDLIWLLSCFISDSALFILVVFSIVTSSGAGVQSVALLPFSSFIFFIQYSFIPSFI